MLHPQVTYLHLKPYHYKYSEKTLYGKYISNSNLPYDKSMKLAKVLNIKNSRECLNSDKSDKRDLFKFKSKRIARHIRRFIESSNKTKNIKEKKKNKTRKNKNVVFRI